MNMMSESLGEGKYKPFYENYEQASKSSVYTERRTSKLNLSTIKMDKKSSINSEVSK